MDALRGVAALLVVIGHALDSINRSTPPNFGLAVDFFFVLSGFVVAHAYEPKLLDGRMTVASFVKTRVLRLHPLLIAATLFALFIRVIQSLRGFAHENLPASIVAAVAGILCVPFATLPDDPHVFPLNSPQWSLLAEYLINIVYVVTFPLFRGLRMLIPIILGFVLLVYIVAAVGQVTTGYFMRDWVLGLLRPIYPFFVGVLLARLHRSGRLPDFDMPWTVQAAILLTVLGMPALRFNGTYQLIATAIVFPVLIIGGRTDAFGSRGAIAATWAGALSYPIYILHQPIVHAVPKLPGVHTLPIAAIVVLQTAAAITFSFFMLTLFDKPVRDWLQARRQQR